MKVTLWGTRGSLASPGPDTVRYGGNTSCVEVEGEDGTRLVLDAGTGIRRLGPKVLHNHGRVDVMLTHLHMDHIQGLGFFRPLDEAGRDVHIWGPPSTTMDLRARLGRYLSPPLFPVRLKELPCTLTLHDVPLDGFEIGGLRIQAALVCHPGPTVGYRISENGRSIAYIPDHEPALGTRGIPKDKEWISGFDLAQDTELLIHDCQYSMTEYTGRVGWGHSAIPHALKFAARAGVRRFVTFHHDPSRDDAALDRMIDEARLALDDESMQVLPGAEGAQFSV
jgi:phosphoribosyl 1,2-cyclic phosphodiesterase